MSDKIVVIEASHYQRVRDALAKDPVIVKMAEEVGTINDPEGMTHDGGHPRYSFMLWSLREYRARGGTIESHIGGPAEAILALLKVPRQ